MLDCGLLRASQEPLASLAEQHERRHQARMDIFSLFIGWHPDDVLLRQVSVDMAELVIVFGTIALTLAIMVVFGNWWSR